MDTGTAGTGSEFHNGTGHFGKFGTSIPGTGHFGNFDTTSIPVPGTSVNSVRHPYRYRTGNVAKTPLIICAQR